MSILSDIKDKLYPEDFDVWEYENAPFQSRKDYLSFEQTLKLISQPPKKTLELVLKEKYDQQLSLGSKRRQKLKRHREFLSASRGLMYMSFIVSLISPFVNFLSGVSETAIIAAMSDVRQSHLSLHEIQDEPKVSLSPDLNLRHMR